MSGTNRVDLFREWLELAVFKVQSTELKSTLRLVNISSPRTHSSRQDIHETRAVSSWRQDESCEFVESREHWIEINLSSREYLVKTSSHGEYLVKTSRHGEYLVERESTPITHPIKRCEQSFESARCWHWCAVSSTYTLNKSHRINSKQTLWNSIKASVSCEFVAVMPGYSKCALNETHIVNPNKTHVIKVSVSCEILVLMRR